MHEFYGGGPNAQSPALTLAYPLLWAAMSPEMEGRMDEEQRQRIRDAYSEINQLPDGTNPVVRVHLRVLRLKNMLVIDEIFAENYSGGAQNGPAPAATGNGAWVHSANAPTPSDFKRFMDMQFLHNQHMVRMQQNQYRMLETLINGVSSTHDDWFSTINQNMTM